MIASTDAALPEGLEPWAAALGLLDPAVAVGLGPLVRHLDALMSRGQSVSSPTGALEGYDGVTSQGSVERILATEWALADVLPDEFLRRAVSGELTYLRPAFEAPRPQGSLMVLLDVGSDQLGACRLVQLAALVVLHRRAHSLGVVMSIGLLGSEVTWRQGPLGGQLRAWHGARSAVSPDPEEVKKWVASADSADLAEMWLVGGPTLVRDSNVSLDHCLTIWESAWTDAGVVGVTVRFGGIETELALPRREVSVRALRRPLRQEEPGGAGSPVLRSPLFANRAMRVLGRGATASELVSIALERDLGRERARSHYFEGDVLAATVYGSRTIAVVLRMGMVGVEIVGKPLGRLEDIAVSPAELGIDPDALDSVLGNLTPAFVEQGALLFAVGSDWFRLHEHGSGPRAIYRIAPGDFIDRPRIAVRQSSFAVLSNVRGLGHAPADGLILGPGPFVGIMVGTDVWRIEPGGTVLRTQGGVPVGLSDIGGAPALLEVGKGGVLLRLHSATGTRTMSRWDTFVGVPQLHPREPWVLLTRPDGHVVVGDLVSGRLKQLTGPIRGQ